MVVRAAQIHRMHTGPDLRCPIVPGQAGHYGGVTGMGEIGVEKTQELLSRIQG